MALELFKPEPRIFQKKCQPPFIKFCKRAGYIYFSASALREYRAEKGTGLNIFVDSKKRIIAFDFGAENPAFKILAGQCIYTKDLIQRYDWKQSELNGGRYPLHGPDTEIGMPYIKLGEKIK